VNDLIYCQRDIPKEKWRYGFRTSAATGCGWIATFNALRLMGYRAEPEKLIRMYEVFHAVSMEFLDTECSIMVNVSKGKNCSMRIMADHLLEEKSAEHLRERIGKDTRLSFDKEEEVTYITC